MYLPIIDVHKKYNGQWVFLINCRLTDRGSIAGGEVALHSENRERVIRDIDKYDHDKSETYFSYAGEAPEGFSMLI
jgi:hypothetical protein